MSEQLTTERKVQDVRCYLDHCQGTQEWHRMGFSRLVYTDGAKFIADTLGAHWLLDLIASWQLRLKVRGEPFQVWTLDRHKDGTSYVATCTDGDKGNGPVTVARQVIPYSDFPAELLPFRLYCEGGVIMLPGER